MMRTLLLSCLSLTLAHAAMSSPFESGAPCASLGAPAAQEPPLLLDGPSYAARARASYMEGEYRKAALDWQKCVSLKYDFLQSEDGAIDLYTDTLRHIGLYTEALDAWKVFMTNTQPSRVPTRYYEAAASCALGAGSYVDALDYIQQFMATGGQESASTSFIKAQSHTFLNNTREALYHWGNYFSLDSPDHIAPASYFNAAQEFYMADRHKEAAKYIKLFIEQMVKQNQHIMPYAHAMAARIYFASKNTDSAVAQWEAFFAHKDTQPGLQDYLSAGLAFDGAHQYEKARDLFQTYYDLTPKEYRILPCVLGLGRIYATLNDAHNAVRCFDEVLNASPERHKELAPIQSVWFLAGAATYVVLDQPEKLAKLIKLHDRLKPDAPSLLNYTLTKQAGPKRSFKKKTLSHLEMARIIKKNIIASEIQHCEDLIKRLAKSTFPPLSHLEDHERTRVELMGDVSLLKRQLSNQGASVSTASGLSSSSCESTAHDNLLALRRKITSIERACDNLDRSLGQAKKEHRKMQIASYLETLAHDAPHIESFPRTQNMRAQFGHAKPEITQAPPSPLSFSSSAPIAQSPAVAPVVRFTQLPHVHGQLDKLAQIPGHLAKYNTYLEEIASGPTTTTHKSGHFKALVGEKGLFAYRFDKGNRLT
ncbi:MAG: tetratricopeptide repeat protein [Proteobacteria bacterium]|nr:tetratricopeptide repeat protein [Pseudomonadota bacterium]